MSQDQKYCTVDEIPFEREGSRETLRAMSDVLGGLKIGYNIADDGKHVITLNLDAKHANGGANVQYAEGINPDRALDKLLDAIVRFCVHGPNRLIVLDDTKGGHNKEFFVDGNREFLSFRSISPVRRGVSIAAARSALAA